MNYILLGKVGHFHATNCNRFGFFLQFQRLSPAGLSKSSSFQPKFAFQNSFFPLSNPDSTLTILLHRERTGEGQVVTGSLLSTALSFFSFHIMEEYTRNLEREAIGNRSPYGAPVDMISTKDGWIAVQVLGQGIFKRWAHMMGREDLLENPKFRNDLARGDHGGEISSILHVWARQYTNAEALDILEKARIPSGPVYAPVDIMKDKHIQEMGCFQGLDFPGVSKAPPLVETPVQLSQNKNTIRTRAPLLGEHTKDILKSLGYDDHHIAGFYQEGAV